MREKLIYAARDFLCLPFRHHGRGGAGIDCAGLVIMAALKSGLITTEIAQSVHIYARAPNASLMQRELSRLMIVKSLQDAMPGDVVYLREPNPSVKYAYHLGILTEFEGQLGLIHSSLRQRKVVEHRLDSTWRARVVSCYSFPLTQDEVWPKPLH